MIDDDEDDFGVVAIVALFICIAVMWVATRMQRAALLVWCFIEAAWWIVIAGQKPMRATPKDRISPLDAGKHEVAGAPIWKTDAAAPHATPEDRG
jgi:hypothetical protein